MNSATEGGAGGASGEGGAGATSDHTSPSSREGSTAGTGGASRTSAVDSGALGASSGEGFAWVQDPVDVPRLSYHIFESELLGTEVGVHVLVPMPYEQRPHDRFDVLYWLHGGGGGRAGLAPLSSIFLEGMREGHTAPFLVVFPESPPLSLWVDACEGEQVESMLVEELVPFIDETFRTRAEASGRWVEGFSMGGFGALRLAFLHGDIFAHVSSLGAGPLSPDLSDVPRVGPEGVTALLDDLWCGDIDRYRDEHPWELAASLPEDFGSRVTLRMAIGDRDNSHPNKVQFHERLQSLGVAHDFFLVEGVGHSTAPLLEGLGAARWGFYPQP